MPENLSCPYQKRNLSTQGKKQLCCLMPEERALNIDSPFDLELVRGVIERRGNEKANS